MIAVLFHCPVCLLDWPENYCDSCGCEDLQVSTEINRAAEHPGKEVPQPPTEVNAT